MKLRVLSKQDVQQSVSMREAIEIVKGAFTQLSAGKGVVPPRTQLPVERVSATLTLMELKGMVQHVGGMRYAAVRETNRTQGGLDV